MEAFYQTLSRISQIQKTFDSWTQGMGTEMEKKPISSKLEDQVPSISMSEQVDKENNFLNILTENIRSETSEKNYPFEKLITAASQKYGLPDSLIKSVIQVESNFNQNAVSPKGAIGLMQLMPGTASQYTVQEPFSPEENIDTGSRHLRNLLNRYDGNLIKALAAYNAGENSFKNDAIPGYKETQNYVKKVIENYMKYNGVAL